MIKNGYLRIFEKVEETAERKPDKVVMDTGYYSGENVEEAEKPKI